MKNNHLIWWAWIWAGGYSLAIMLPQFEITWLVYVGLALTVGALWFFKLPGKSFIGFIILMSIAFGYYQWVDQHNQTQLHLVNDKEKLTNDSFNDISVEVNGIITSPIDVDGDHVGFTIRTKRLLFAKGSLDNDEHIFSIQESIKVSLRLLEQEEQATALTLQRGDDISFKGTLLIPAAARNFGGFDYQQYLRQQHIHWMLAIKGLDSVTSESSFHWNWLQLLRYNDQFRGFLAHKLEQLFPESQAGYMKSLLIGLRVDLDPEQFQQFSNLGLTHILAISGMQVAVFCAVVLWILRKLRFTKETGLLIVIALLPFYVLFTGSSPSVVRAGLMAMIALYAVRRNWLKDGLKLLCLVGWLMLLWNPYALLDVSFQLSFAVTYGLIVGVPWVSSLLPKQKTMNLTLAVTLVAQTISFPLTIYYFNQFSLLSWLANIILVPFISFAVTPIATVALITSLVSMSLGKGIAWLAALSNRLTFWLTAELDSWSSFHMIWSSPSLAWMIAYYTLIAVVIGCLVRWKAGREAKREGVYIRFILQSRGVSIAVICNLLCLFLLLWYGYHPEMWRNGGQVQFIDVGQGDAILIRTPSNKYILVDGGGTLVFRKQGDEWKQRKKPYEVGKNTLVPLLKKRGVHQLDYLISTHEDTDHIGGLQAVIEQIPVRNFIFNGTLKPNLGVEKLFKTALDLNIPLEVGHAALKLRVDSKTIIHFLYPIKQENEIVDTDNAQQFYRLSVEKKQNNDCLVFLLEMYHSRFLFTGDMEKNSENDVLEYLSDMDSKSSHSIDVLKVAHHGSKTSTSEDWLDFWLPKQAVISVGEHNTYGHPTEEVLTRLAEHDIQVYRTDELGEVDMLIKENGIHTRVKFTDDL
ncbi:MAG: DNA internalization-related competence protein ComEC/Rec2 [Paenibacillaceae bacterium]